jgi:hypothetical protein
MYSPRVEFLSASFSRSLENARCPGLNEEYFVHMPFLLPLPSWLHDGESLALLCGGLSLRLARFLHYHWLEAGVSLCLNFHFRFFQWRMYLSSAIWMVSFWERAMGGRVCEPPSVFLS